MARTHPVIQTFAAGELSETLEGRNDFPKFRAGAKTLKNYLVRPQGAVEMRGGSQYIATSKLNSEIRLIDFQVSVTDSYILEFGNLYIRVYRDRAQILSGGSPVEIVTPYTTTQLSEIQYAQSADVLYIAHPDHQSRTLSRTSDISWTLATHDVEDGPFLPESTTGITLTASATTGTGITVTASAPTFDAGHVGALFLLRDATGAIPYSEWTSGEAGINKGDIRQFEKNIYRARRSAAVYGVANITQATPAVVTTSAPHGLLSGQRVLIESVGGMTEVNDNQYYVGAPAATTFELYVDAGLTTPVNSAGYGAYTSGGTVGRSSNLTAGAIPPRHSTGAASDGTVLWDFFALEGGVIKVTGFTSSTQITADVVEQLLDSALSGTSFWAEGAWSAHRGFPKAVTFYEQRLFWAGTAYRPQTLWGSAVDNYTSHSAGQGFDSDAVEYTLATQQLNSILWLSAGKTLAIGTARGEFTASGASLEEPMTPSSIRIVRQATSGSDAIVPLRINDSALFVQRGGRKLREYAPVFESSSGDYIARDLNILAEHITESRIKEIAYQQESGTVVWCVLNDGSLAAMTYQVDQDVIAWHRHTIAGGSVESIAAIPSSIVGEDDEVWIAVRRVINGATVRYIELLRDPWRSPTPIEDAFFVDSGLTAIFGSPASVVTGLSHLEGETVSILADGAPQPSKIVAGGQITLNRAALKVHVGLFDNAEIVTLPIEVDMPDGTSYGRRKRASKLRVRVKDSVGITVFDPNESATETVTFRGSSAMDTAVVPKSGDLETTGQGGWSSIVRIGLRQSQPLPSTVLLIAPVLEVND